MEPANFREGVWEKRRGVWVADFVGCCCGGGEVMEVTGSGAVVTLGWRYWLKGKGSWGSFGWEEKRVVWLRWKNRVRDLFG